MNRRVKELMSYLRAAAFIAHCRIKGGRVSEKYTQLRVNGEYLEARVYLPRGFNGKDRNPGTILVIHGMSSPGSGDPRIIEVCRALAKCGHVVVSPMFRDIAGFRISHATVDRITGTVRVLARDSVLCRDGRLSIFAPSFSAGMSMIAASMPGTADIVRAICSVGAYGSVDTVIHDLMSRQDRDPYGRLIIMKNFIRHAPGFGGKTAGALHEAILDNGLMRSAPRFPAKLASLEKKQRRRVTRLLNDPAFRLRQWGLVISQSKRVVHLIERLSVVENIGGIRARVALIHGKNDNVIPPGESVALMRRLRELRVPSRICITPLIGHGDAALGRGFITHAWDLLSAFAFFFRHSRSDTAENA